MNWDSLPQGVVSYTVIIKLQSTFQKPVQHDRTKHVEVDIHFIKEKLEAKVIKLPHVKSKDQLADILTKVVGTQFFEVLCKLGVGDPTTHLEREC